MVRHQSHPSDQRLIIRELVYEIETLRKKRRQMYIDQDHPESKRFTQEELCDAVCPSYKNLVQGFTGRLPSREMVQQIATYLECTLHERNDLLLAAQYLPEQLELPEDQHQHAFQNALNHLQTLPFPAHAGSHGMVDKVNQHFLVLNGLPPDGSFPRHTILDANFDPTSPACMHLHAGAWQKNAHTTVTLFRRLYTHFQRELWYREQVKKARIWPEFSNVWDTNGAKVHSVQSEVIYTVPAGTEGPVVRLHGYLLTFGTPNPYIFCLIPSDGVAYQAFANLGIPVLENRWEHAI